MTRTYQCQVEPVPYICLQLEEFLMHFLVLAYSEFDLSHNASM